LSEDRIGLLEKVFDLLEDESWRRELADFTPSAGRAEGLGEKSVGVADRDFEFAGMGRPGSRERAKMLIYNNNINILLFYIYIFSSYSFFSIKSLNFSLLFPVDPLIGRAR